MLKIALLPYKCRYAGLALILTGLILSIVYIWFDFRVTLPVFAMISAFYEVRFFTLIQTNVADELILLSLMTGLALIVLAKEHHENEHTNTLRLLALFRAMVLNISLLMASLLFVFGSGFVSILIFNLFSFPLFYIIFFRYLRYKHREKTSTEQT